MDYKTFGVIKCVRRLIKQGYSTYTKRHLLQKMPYTRLVMNHGKYSVMKMTLAIFFGSCRSVRIEKLRACTIFTETQVGIVSALYSISDERRAVTSLKLMTKHMSFNITLQMLVHTSVPNYPIMKPSKFQLSPGKVFEMS
jgi:hypothetical protein